MHPESLQVSSPCPRSLYIHFPFCVKKCRYCDFYSCVQAEDKIIPYIDALAEEWDMISDRWFSSAEPQEFSTVYCGGGTPSLLSDEQWRYFCARLMRRIPVSRDAEWTIECNPESFTAQKARAWLETGVNRITIGVQSLDDRELSVMGRAHTSAQAIAVLDHPCMAQFKSIGIDCMYCLPGQTLESLGRTITLLSGFSLVTHLSAYELTIAENTVFGRHRRFVPLPAEEACAAMTERVLELARAYGFIRYEISNFCKPGFECRHNMAYWNHAPYIGLGASAHSYLCGARYANVSSLTEYCGRIARGVSPVDFSENIGREQLGHEMVFLRLRTADGLDEQRFFRETGKVFANPHRELKLREFAGNGFVEHAPPFWRLTASGMMFADAIARELF
jgi:oxygen-independent coproporphyrinogen-3 oxidase